jgi:dihydroorotase
MRLLGLSAIVGLTFSGSLGAQSGTVYDRVILGGRVMDPESGLDAVRNVGIVGGRVAALSTAAMTGRDTLDARGLVVAPGFIDLHQHWQEFEGYRFQAQDGVTTSLELESGTYPIERFYAAREGKAAVNFGASASHGGIRAAVLADSARRRAALANARTAQDTIEARFPGAYRTASPDEQAEIVRRMEQSIRAGSIGLGFGIAYTPGAARDEIFRLFQLGARERVPSFVHVRSSGPSVNGGTLDAMEEVIANAATTGASIHIVHVTSSSARQTPVVLEMIRGARARGLDVTTELYPYEAASTGLQTAIFDPGWQDRIEISYGDILWPATGERLTAETFAKYRAQGGNVVIFAIPLAAMHAALADSMVLVASDGMPLISGQGHPRGIGTFSRVVGRFVREEKRLSLMDALRKVTIMPARRLEGAVPQMRTKGRIREGADADITVFDPARIIDRATYEKPAQPSAGIMHVLVNGTPVVRGGVLQNVTPGVAIRRPAR